jgi:hypothetical protein
MRKERFLTTWVFDWIMALKLRHVFRLEDPELGG